MNAIEAIDACVDAGRPDVGNFIADLCQLNGVLAAAEARAWAAVEGGLLFEELRSVNVPRCARWHSDGVAWNIAEWTNAMQGEAGEAGNVAKKIRRVETSAHWRASEQDVPELEAKLGDELADTVIYCDLTAAERSIDLAAAIRSKFNRTSEEYGFPERL